MSIIIGRTRLLHPSLLDVADACRLRYLLSTEDGAFRRLPPSPTTLVGLAIHSFLEKGVEAARWGPSDVKEKIFDEIREAMAEWPTIRVILIAATGSDSAAGLLSPSAWASRIRLARRLLATVEREPHRRTRGLRNSRLGSEERLPEAIVIEEGTEARVIHPILGVSGRADSLVRRGSHYEVTEFKSGPIYVEGVLSPRYRLQVGAYACAIRVENPAASIRLKLVGIDGEFVGDYDAQWHRDVLDALDRARTKLPMGQIAAESHWASPGAPCLDCDVRQRCNAYRTLLWRSSREHDHEPRGPYDLHGHLIDMRRSGHDLWDIRLEVAQHHRAVVFGVPNAFVEAVSVGMRITGFNLRAASAGSARPTNFRVTDTENFYRSAYSSVLEPNA